MKFVEVKDIPNRKRHHRLKDYWDEFMCMNVKTAKIDFDIYEYSNPDVARSVIANSIKRFGYPIDINKRGNEIYLIRRDI